MADGTPESKEFGDFVAQVVGDSSGLSSEFIRDFASSAYGNYSEHPSFTIAHHPVRRGKTLMANKLLEAAKAYTIIRPTTPRPGDCES